MGVSGGGVGDVMGRVCKERPPIDGRSPHVVRYSVGPGLPGVERETAVGRNFADPRGLARVIRHDVTEP